MNTDSQPQLAATANADMPAVAGGFTATDTSAHGYVCVKCGKGCANKQGLSNHFNTKHRGGAEHCSNCQPGQLCKRHKNYNGGTIPMEEKDKVNCPACHRLMPIRFLSRHLAIKHAHSEVFRKNRIPCSRCSKIFRSVVQLAGHLRVGVLESLIPAWKLCPRSNIMPSELRHQETRSIAQHLLNHGLANLSWNAGASQRGKERVGESGGRAKDQAGGYLGREVDA